MRSSRWFWVGVGCSVVAGVVLWLIFQPGLMSEDSAGQYQGARANEFSDWHPAVLGIAIWGVLRLGGDLGWLTFLQAVASCLGLYLLLLETLLLWKRDGPWGDREAGLALAGFAVLLAPPSPFLYYTMSFIKDGWTLVLMTWLGWLSLHLYRRGPDSGGAHFALACTGLCLVTSLFVLVRHNAVAVLPWLFVLNWLSCRRRGLRWAPLLALVPLLLPFALKPALHAAFHVQAKHHERLIMVNDLVGLFVLDDGARAEFPFMASHLEGERFRDEYRFGDVVPVLFSERPLVDGDLVWQKEPRLPEEYLRAWRTHFGTMLEVKWRAYRQLLGDYSQRYLVPSEAEPVGFVLNERYAPVRRGLYAYDEWLNRLPPLHWLVSLQVLWIGVDAALAAGLLVWWRRHGEPAHLFFAVWLLVPLTYYASYFVATFTPDYRFMYPSTLVVQAAALAAALHGLAAWLFPGSTQGSSSP